jgi:hypothetical protein
MSKTATNDPRRMLLLLACCAATLASAACSPSAAPAPGDAPHSITRLASPLVSAAATQPRSKAQLTGGPRVGGDQGQMLYRGGHVMVNTTKLYYIWYGDWSQDAGTITLLESFAQNIGGSGYFNINSTYSNTCAQSVQNAVTFAGHTFDSGSQGTALGDYGAQYVVERAITTGALPADSDAIYFVLTAPAVTEGDFCHARPGNTGYCGYHANDTVNGVRIQWAFVGDARICGGCLQAGVTFPNEASADSMSTALAHELSESVSDPWGDAWFDAGGAENGDKCVAQWGTTYTTANGGTANTRLGNNDYLLQMIWMNGSNGMCANARTAANATCVDGVRDGAETGVDCGGPCPGCAAGQGCVASSDCYGSYCQAGTCTVANCTNGVRDGIETDVDCGELCPGCGAGKLCTYDSDCLSHKCSGGHCLDHCANGVKDDDESDVDCGGASCAKCATGRPCNVNKDCVTDGCSAGVCVDHCADGHRDFVEGDVDCGDVCPARCATGQGCRFDSDCANGPCDSHVHRCLDHCSDGVADYGETDVDCGGSCAPCATGLRCSGTASCVSHHCQTGACACATNADCPGGTCQSWMCSNRCTNGKRDFGESDIDCGGSCTGCSPGLKCLSAADCRSGTCTGGVCQCVVDGDCATGQACVGGQCLAHCTDKVKDQGETDVDCGGSTSTCAVCSIGKHCTAPSDCSSHFCSSGVCKCTSSNDCATGQICRLGGCLDHCFDKTKDFDEVGTDCGGSCLAQCPICSGP